MEAAWVTSLLLTTSSRARHAAMPVSRSSARRRREMRSGVTENDYGSGLRALSLGFVPKAKSPAPSAVDDLRAAEVGTGAAGGARRTAVHAALSPAAIGVAASRLVGVGPRFLDAALRRVLRAIDELAATVGPARCRFRRTAVLLGGLGAKVPCLLAERTAQFVARLRVQQHTEARAEHGAGEQAHHESVALPVVLVPIEAIRHCGTPLPSRLSDTVSGIGGSEIHPCSQCAVPSPGNWGCRA